MFFSFFIHFFFILVILCYNESELLFTCAWRITAAGLWKPHSGYGPHHLWGAPGGRENIGDPASVPCSEPRTTARVWSNLYGDLRPPSRWFALDFCGHSSHRPPEEGTASLSLSWHWCKWDLDFQIVFQFTDRYWRIFWSYFSLLIVF